MKTLHLFAGGGGSALADLIRGRTPAAFCEIDKGCRAVLGKRFPDAPCFPDVATLTGDMVRKAVGEIDVLSGGSPCQDVSTAGKGLGFTDGARSSLIWHQLRLVAELRPRFMEWENVLGAISPKHRPQFDAFLFELGQLGYGGAWCVLSASQVGAPHQRKRVWLLAERGREDFTQVKTEGLPVWPNAAWPTPRATRNGEDVYKALFRPGAVDQLTNAACMAEISTKHMPAWPHPAAGQAWPTPRACKEEGFAGGIFRDSPMLGTEVLMSEFWATARVSGAGTEDFVRDDGKLRDDLQTMAIMAECVNPAPSAWPTPTVQDGENAAGLSQFARNTLPLNAEVFREFVRNMTPEQVKAIIGDRRLNPAWVENLMGWPIGWTDLACDKVRIPLGSSGEYLFPAGRWMPQRSHEPARITSVKSRSKDAKARNAGLRMLGNGWVPQQAARAFSVLEDHLEIK